MSAMMKRYLYILLSIAALAGLPSCAGDYDDSSLKKKIDDLEFRTSVLEDRCRRINTNVAALQGLVSVSMGSDRITAVAPMEEDGTVTGYIISFCFREPLTVYCGLDGADGADGHDGADGLDGRNGTDGKVPQVSMVSEGGIQYWAIDGTVLTDGQGNKIPVVTTGGAIVDGITPELKVEEGVWYYNVGDGWVRLEATMLWGDGNVFSSVSEAADKVVFSLSDGSEITVLKAEKLEISIAATASIQAGGSVSLDWSVNSATASVEAFPQGDWMAEVVPSSGSTPGVQEGSLRISAPATAAGSGSVLLFATEPSGYSVYKNVIVTVL